MHKINFDIVWFAVLMLSFAFAFAKAAMETCWTSYQFNQTKSGTSFFRKPITYDEYVSWNKDTGLPRYKRKNIQAVAKQNLAVAV